VLSTIAHHVSTNCYVQLHPSSQLPTVHDATVCIAAGRACVATCLDGCTAYTHIHPTLVHANDAVRCVVGMYYSTDIHLSTSVLVARCMSVLCSASAVVLVWRSTGTGCTYVHPVPALHHTSTTALALQLPVAWMLLKDVYWMVWHGRVRASVP